MESTKAHCRAPHPDGDRKPRFARQQCGAYNGEFPWIMEHTNRLFHRLDQVPRGLIGIPCTKCGMVNVWRFVRWIAEPVPNVEWPRQAYYTVEPTPVFTLKEGVRGVEPLVPDDIIVSDFPLRTLMSVELLDNSNPRVMERNGDTLRFLCSNGEATYKIIERFESLGTVGLERVGDPLWKDLTHKGTI